LLTIRDRSGSELVKVSNNAGITAVLAGAAKSAVVEAAEELFQVVRGAAGDDLDRAIDAIKRL